jgi:hypothetical protein
VPASEDAAPVGDYETGGNVAGNRLADDLAQQLSRRDLTDAPRLIVCFLETSALLAACRGEARLNYRLAIDPEDEPVGSSRTRLGCCT